MIGDKAISAFVITYNEERNIAGCLESLKWADELVVVDSFSEDRTVEIAARYTNRIIRREFPGYIAQTRYASEQTTCPWVLWLDADERLTAEALTEVRQILTLPGQPEYKGFAFPRKTFFMGRWITHSGWYPQHKLRLWHRDFGQVGSSRSFHPHVEVQGAVKELNEDILHYSYPGGLKDMVSASTKYAATGAEVAHAAGRRFSFAALLLEPPGTFLKKYLLQFGLLDGLPGLVVSVGTAYYCFIREAMLWELDHGAEPPSSGEVSAPSSEGAASPPHPPS